MNDNETFIVQSDTPDRLYVKVYHDFLDSDLLDRNEKMVFILLKRYLNFKEDLNGIEGQAYPTLDTLSKQCGMSKGAVIRSLKSLKEKKVLTIEQRGLNKPNVYTIKDYSNVWKSGTQEEMAAEIRQHELEKVKKIAKEHGYRLIKEKEVASATDQSTDSTSHDFKLNNSYKNNTIDNDQSQYNNVFTRKMIDEIYDYHLLINDYQGQEDLIDGMLELILEVLNSQSKTTRIKKEEVPTELVKSRYLKLNYMHIKYVIDEVSKQTTEIKNKRAYLLTSLYNSYTTIDVHYANLINKN